MRNILLFLVIIPSISFCQVSLEEINEGIELFNQEKYEQSIVIFTKAINENYDTPHEIYFYRAYAYSKKGEIIKAIEDYKKHISFNPESYKSFFYCGAGYYELNNFEEAEKYFLNTIKIKPDFSKGIWQLGALYEKQGKLADALDNFNKAVNIDSLNVEYYFKRAIFKSYKLNDNSSALVDIAKVVQLDNNYKKEIVLNQYISLLINEKMIIEANKLSDDLINANTNNPIGYYFKGFTNLLLNKDGCKELKKSSELGYEKADKLILKYCKN